MYLFRGPKRFTGVPFIDAFADHHPTPVGMSATLFAPLDAETTAVNEAMQGA